MNMMKVGIAMGVMTGLLVAGGVWAEDMRKSPSPSEHGEEMAMPNGVIGVSLHVGAERIGDPSLLYVGMVHPEGPAHQAGLRHGDEVVTVNGTPVSGKSYEQVVKMIRGEAGSSVKLGVKGEGGTRELSITRIASDKLPKGPSGSHGGSAK